MTPQFQSRTGRVALGGLLTAASVTLLYVAAIAPSGRIGLTALAGLCPMLAVVFSRASLGYLVWGATSLLGLILIPEKGVALGYLVIFGLYPIVKYQLEERFSAGLRWVCKLAYGGMGIILLQRFLLHLMMQEIPHWISERSIPLFVLGLGIFLVYDIGLSRLIRLAVARMGGRETGKKQ